MSRIKLLRNKRDISVKQMRKDIAQLLQTGQEPSARIRVCNSLTFIVLMFTRGDHV